jgi:hypothetical protein
MTFHSINNSDDPYDNPENWQNNVSSNPETQSSSYAEVKNWETIEVEGDSLEEVRRQIKLQIPEGSSLISEEIISNGNRSSIRTYGSTTDVAFAKAESKLAKNSLIIEKKELSGPQQKVVRIKAFEEKVALEEAKKQIGMKYGASAEVLAVKLLVAGKRGFLGWGKEPNEYEVELLQEAVVEISYRPKVKISVKIERYA